MMKRLLAFLTMLPIMSCKEPSTRPNVAVEETTVYVTKAQSYYYVHTIHDSNHDVTCWIHIGGIACLPDKDIKQ